MKYLIAPIAAALAFAIPVAAFAQANPGMQVVDTSGGVVGTVKSVQGDYILVDTGSHEAMLPKASFTPTEGKLLFGMTKAQLDAEIEKSAAAANAAIKPGATVKGLNGAAVGTIDTVDAQNATLKLSSGQSVAVPLSGLRGNPDGTVLIGLTAEQLQAQVGASGAAGSAN
jgi:hypothetical protein